MFINQNLGFNYDLLSGWKGVNNQGIINIDKGGIIYRGVVEDSEDTDIKISPS